MEPYYDRDGITIYCADCRDVLPGLDKVDLLLTDPPYGLNEKWGKGNGWHSLNINGSGKLWKGIPEWDKNTCDDLIPKTINQASHAIVWGGNYYSLPPSNAWLIWDKMQKHSGSEAEMAWTNLDQPVRVYRMSRVEAFQYRAGPAKGRMRGKEKKFHPTQKPIGLMKWSISFTESLSILDPFMGSGTTLRAAKDLGRRAIGIEIEEKYCEIAVKRLAQKVLFN